MHYSRTSSTTLISNSYGYLFRDILLGASNSARTDNTSTATNLTENLNDRTFNFRLPGLNLDFMSYTSLALVQNNSSALLDAKILANISSTVFSTFFKHFVRTSIPTLPSTSINGTWGTQPLASTPSVLHARDATNTATTTSITISTPVIKLAFDTTTTILSLSILVVLLTTTVFVAIYHKRYLKPLPRDVDTLGSVLGFVYSSERLLRSAEYGNERKDKAMETVRMGWFNGGGKRRWGIEIVDSREDHTAELSAQEDVDPVRLESSDSRFRTLRGSGERGSSSLESRHLRPVAEAQVERDMRERAMSIDDFNGAYNTMAIRTPPLPVASPPIGGSYVYR
jgi:hypothetical protein